MHKVITSQLTPSMIVARDVYNNENQLIVPEGFKLTDRAILKLEFYSIPYIFIADENGSEEEEPIAEMSYSARVRQSPAFKKFSEEFQKDVSNFKNVLNDVVEKNTPLDTDALMNETLALLNHTHGSIHIFDMLHNMRKYDDLTYTHGINVGLICNVLATWLDMSKEEIALATKCGLLHDIGKLKIPEAIIKKPTKLTDQEYSIIKKHPVAGFQILKECGVDPNIMKAALMHHERCDGTGYPLALMGPKINKFAKIVAIADVYDAMTSARVYRGPLCPFKVIEIFENEGLQKYDAEYILTFLQNVLNTYISHQVLLSDGRKAEVLFINNQSLSRPLIRCGEDYIDLSKESPELTIEEIL